VRIIDACKCQQRYSTESKGGNADNECLGQLHPEDLKDAKGQADEDHAGHQIETGGDNCFN
jgi:hypothetical protein